jgi:dipeptide/tripeptide permease
MTIADDASGDGVVDWPNGRWLTPGVGAVGAASSFSDSGHEMTTSLLPAFLTGTLGASAAALGVIDGISDALIGVMKLIGGPLANDPHRRARTAAAFSAGFHGVIAFTAAGAGVGLAEPTESAVVAQLLPDRLRGSGFGVLGVVLATGDTVATVVAGLLYALVSPAVAFGYAATWMLAAAIASGTLRRSSPGKQYRS